MALVGKPPPENLYGKQPRPSGGTKKFVHEVVKLIGGISWLVGLIMLFVRPPLGIVILLFAMVLTILSVTWTRQRRHDELVGSAARTAAAPTSPKGTVARLAELDELKALGAVSDDEYAQERKRILKEI